MTLKLFQIILRRFYKYSKAKLGYIYFPPLASAGYSVAGSEPASSIDWTDVFQLQHAAYCTALGIK